MSIFLTTFSQIEIGIEVKKDVKEILELAKVWRNYNL